MVGTVIAIVLDVILASWALLLAVLIGLLLLVMTSRIVALRGRQRRAARAAGKGPAGIATGAAVSIPDGPAAASPGLLAGLAEIRRTDPRFDSRLLLDAGQLTCLFMAAAMATGNDAPLRQVAAPPFWKTRFGGYIATLARDARHRHGPQAAGSGLIRVPVDYQATVPELIALVGGTRQQAIIRVSFSQLAAVIGAGASNQTAAVSATSMVSLGAAFGRMARGTTGGGSVEASFLAWSGRLDLRFTRPGDARTDPGTALAARACANCGATYRAELATSCEHCGAARPVAWGQWRLADIKVAG
jgi:hypothetical protein